MNHLGAAEDVPAAFGEYGKETQWVDDQDQAREGDLVTLWQNGAVLMFRGNMIYNAFIATRDSRKYFKDQLKQLIKVTMMGRKAEINV